MYLLPQYFVYIYISTTFYYMYTQKVKNNLEYTLFFTDSYQNTKNTAAFAKDLIAPLFGAKAFATQPPPLHSAILALSLRESKRRF